MGSLKSSVGVDSHARQSGEKILGIHVGLKCVSVSPCMLKASLSYLSGTPYRRKFKIHSEKLEGLFKLMLLLLVELSLTRCVPVYDINHP